jgi:hypothetical protein
MMKSRIVPIAVFLGLLCGQALAQQQPAGAPKTSAGTTRNPSAPVPGSGSLGGKAMLKPGQAFVGGKVSAPVGGAVGGGAHP